MELVAAGQAFDRAQALAPGLEREDRARAHGTVVQQHGAGTTDLDVARLLHPQQPEAVAQALDQRLGRGDAQLVLVAVDDHGHRDLSHRPALPSTAARACSQARRRSTPTRCSLYSAEPWRSVMASAARAAIRAASGSAATLSAMALSLSRASASRILRGTGPTEPTAIRASATRPSSSVTATPTPTEGRSRKPNLRYAAAECPGRGGTTISVTSSSPSRHVSKGPTESSNDLSILLPLAVQLRRHRGREAIHDVGALPHDDAVAQRPQLAEDADVGRELQRGPPLDGRQAYREVHLDEAVDGRVAPARAGAQARGCLDLEHLDLQGDLHLERPDLLADDGGVTLSLLDRPDLFRPRDAGGQPRHVPEKVQHRLPRRLDPDLALDFQAAPPLLRWRHSGASC